MIKVIVVEDEAKIRKGFINLINWQEYDCQVVADGKNGQIGIELIQKFCPDIVFVDIKMPVLSGLEMIQSTIEEYGYHAVIISGYGDFAYAQEAIHLGVSEYLVKPVDKKELISVLERIVRKIYKKRGEQSDIETCGFNDTLTQLILTKPRIVHSSYVLECIQYIEKHYNEKILLSSISDQLKVSNTKLNNLLKNDTGYTFHEYLTRFRILKALELLQNDKMLVYEIAVAVGFDEYKYFNAVFKKYVGVSPTELRKSAVSPSGKQQTSLEG